MANIKTLKKNADRTHDELAAMGRKGGLASGAKKREIKKMTEAVRLILSAPLDKNEDEITERTLRDFDVPENLWCQKLALACTLITKAKSGDVRAAELVLKLAGEFPSDYSQHNQVNDFF